MSLQFNDGSSTVLGWQNIVNFATGGLDVLNNYVLDWGKAKSCGWNLHSSYQGGLAEFGIGNLSIVKGDATDVHFNDTGSGLKPENEIATIGITGCTTHIGPVSTAIDGDNTVVTFSVAISATIGNETNRVSIPTDFNVQITHTPDENIIEYGMTFDWSSAKNFPCGSMLSDDDLYSLVAGDQIGGAHSGSDGIYRSFFAYTMEDLGTNDTALLKDEGTTFMTYRITKNYHITGNSTLFNTTRVYFENAFSTSGKGGIQATSYGSVVFVIFDNLTYGNSTGITFDPIVEIPYTISGIAGFPPEILLLCMFVGLFGLTAVVWKKIRVRRPLMR